MSRAERRSRNSGPVLTVAGLFRSFDGSPVLEGIDLQLEAGTRLGLRGPNGCGKTTLLRCVAGTLTPTTGGVSVIGHEAGSSAARSAIGVSLSQERSFYHRLTGHQNLIFFARIRGFSKPQAQGMISDLERELEIQNILSRAVGECSTGMIQQLSLARALLGRPELLLLDEPSRSLDEGAIRRMWAALDRRRDKAVVIASHRQQDLERCDEVLDL